MRRDENELAAKSKPALKLATALGFYVAIEFLVVAEFSLWGSLPLSRTFRK